MFSYNDGNGQNQRQHVCFVQFTRWRHHSVVSRRYDVMFGRDRQLAAPVAKSTTVSYLNVFYVSAGKATQSI